MRNAHKLGSRAEGGENVNEENIREFRTVRGEDEVNALLATRKWRADIHYYDEETLIAKMVKVRE